MFISSVMILNFKDSEKFYNYKKQITYEKRQVHTLKLLTLTFLDSSKSF